MHPHRYCQLRRSNRQTTRPESWGGSPWPSLLVYANVIGSTGPLSPRLRSGERKAKTI